MWATRELAVSTAHADMSNTSRSIAVWDSKAELRLLAAKKRYTTAGAIYEKSAWLRHRFTLPQITTKLQLLKESVEPATGYSSKGESDEDDTEYSWDARDETKLLRKRLKELQDSLLQAELALQPIYLPAKGRIYIILPLPPRAKARIHVSASTRKCSLQVSIPPLESNLLPNLGPKVHTRRETLKFKLALEIPVSAKSLKVKAISRVDWPSHTAIWCVPLKNAASSSTLSDKPTLSSERSFRV